MRTTLKALPHSKAWQAVWWPAYRLQIRGGPNEGFERVRSPRGRGRGLSKEGGDVRSTMNIVPCSRWHHCLICFIENIRILSFIFQNHVKLQRMRCLPLNLDRSPIWVHRCFPRPPTRPIQCREAVLSSTMGRAE